MSEPELPANQQDQDPSKKFSPFAGCSIFIIAGVLAASMVAFTFWIGTRVENTIAGFTEETAKPITTVKTKDKQSEQVALKSKLIAFRHAVETKKKANLTLTAEDLNLAIATFDILEPHRGNLYITAISPEGITAEISNPINSKMSNMISQEKSFRYLNGNIIIRPELAGSAVFPRITKIRPHNGGSVPEEFIQQMSKTLLHPFTEDKAISPIFNRLSAVEIQDAQLILRTDPDFRAAAAPPENKQPLIERFMKGFAVVAVIFLAITTAIIILSRRKARQS